MAASTPKNAPKKGLTFSRLRGFALAALLVFCVAGLALRFGAGTLSAWGIEGIVALCPLGALEAMLGAREFMLHPFILLVAALVIVAFTGKAFCSWLCPTPWIQRFFSGKKSAGAGSGSSELGDGAEAGGDEEQAPCSAEELAAIDASIERELASAGCGGSCGSATGCSSCLEPLGGARDGLQLDSRHGVLLGALGSTAIFGFPVFCLLCPVGLSIALVVTVWNTLTANSPSWALLVIPAVLLLELVFFKKWCHKICPLGALLSLVSNLNFSFKPKVDGSACLRSQGVDCHACVDACPEQVDPHSKRIPECSKCGACVEACPAHAIAIQPL